MNKHKEIRLDINKNNDIYHINLPYLLPLASPGRSINHLRVVLVSQVSSINTYRCMESPLFRIYTSGWRLSYHTYYFHLISILFILFYWLSLGYKGVREHRGGLVWLWYVCVVWWKVKWSYCECELGVNG